MVRLEPVLPLATSFLGAACKAGMVVAPSAGVLTPGCAQSNLRAVQPDVLPLVSVVREGGLDQLPGDQLLCAVVLLGVDGRAAGCETWALTSLVRG